MEFIQQLQTLFSSSLNLVTAVAAIFALLFKVAAPLVRALEWHDRYFVRKRLSHLESVRSSVTSSPQLSRFLDDAITLEGFRIASGVSTSRAKMEFLIDLSQDGLWSEAQLRSAAKFLYVEPGNSEPSLLNRP